MVMSPVAHTSEDGGTQSLEAHARQTADLASSFASKFGAGDAGRRAGLWHDLGKASAAFQDYLRSGARSRGPDHKSAGAVVANGQGAPLLAFAIAGHHAGLPDRADLLARLNERTLDPEVTRFLAQLPPHEATVPLPDFLKRGTEQERRRKAEFFTRMLFSCLVDADFLDTEAFMEPSRAAVRRASLPSVGELAASLRSHLEGLAERGPVDALRNEVQRCAAAAARRPVGFFSLTAPTGAGKTLAGMRFALEHAAHHGLDRVIVVIPYTSVIEQTAAVYRDVFGEQAVVEHHSTVAPKDETPRSRLASENWDAPIIVTTSVQFFDSLHANRPGRCRKLHNIARSVVILDEVQTLPPGLLGPILDVLRQLVAHYGTTVVFSTATMPAFRSRPGLEGVGTVTEIVSNPPGLFARFSRHRPVDFDVRPGAATWADIASRMCSEKQALTVVNTKKDARALFDLLPPGDAFYLTTNLCAAHRRARFKKIADRLERGGRCLVASTQLVEVGVDLDFPVVFRAIGPLDAIVQSAGRCNREGRRERGSVVVFEPAEGGLPRGTYRTATDHARRLLEEASPRDFHDPRFFERYFAALYADVDLDARRVLAHREKFQFSQVARAFHLIDDDTVPVLVPFCRGRHLSRRIRAIGHLTRTLHRQIQQYVVALHRGDAERALREGLAEEPVPGLYEWRGTYDKTLGLVWEGPDARDLIG